MESMPGIHIELLLVLFVAIPVASAILLQWATQHSPLSTALRSYSGVVAPFFVSVALLFGLFATFLAADIWERVNDYNHSLEQEVGAIQTIRQIAVVLGERGQTIDLAVSDYTNIALGEEINSRTSPRSPAANLALGELARAILAPEVAQSGGSAAQGALLSSFIQLREARATRIHIASSHSDPYKWATVIVLGIMTQIALIFCHIDNRKAQSAALFIFTLAFVVTLAALGIHERPLADPTLVSLDHISRLGD